MDSYCESMDSFGFENHESGLLKIRVDLGIMNLDFWRFVSIRRSRIQTFEDLYQFRDHEYSQFSNDSTNPVNLANPHESLVHRRTIDKRILASQCHESSQIQIFGLTNSDLWIRFGTWILNYPFCGFVSGFFFFKTTRFVLFRKDLYTIPASLIFRLTW